MIRRSHHRFAQFLIFCCFFSLLLSCKQQKQSMPEQQSHTNQQIFRIGLIPERNLFDQTKRYEPLLSYLSDELGVTFKSIIMSRYGNIIDNFSRLELDGAFLGSFTGAMAIERLSVDPIARPQYLDGASTYFGIVFVKKDSGIRTAEDMRGKRMVFVDRATTAGYLLPLAFFKTLGIADYTTWFSEFYFSGTHEDSILDVLNGLADIGAAKNTVFYRMATTHNQVLEELEILAISPHVPSNGLVVGKDFPPELKKRLQEKLLSLHQTSAGQKVLNELEVELFIKTSKNDYQPVWDYANKIGLNLSSYKYLGD